MKNKVLHCDFKETLQEKLKHTDDIHPIRIDLSFNWLVDEDHETILSAIIELK
jgi:hypothetical protein